MSSMAPLSRLVSKPNRPVAAASPVSLIVPKGMTAPPVLPDRSIVLTALMILIINVKRSCCSCDWPAPLSISVPIVSLLPNALTMGTGVSNMSMNGWIGLVNFCTVVTMSPRKPCMKLSASKLKFWNSNARRHQLVARAESPVQIERGAERRIE